MVAIRVDIIVIFMSTCMLSFITCRSLRHILDNENCWGNQRNTSNICSSDFQIDVIRHNLKEPPSAVEESTMAAILRNPCILVKIMSLLSINRVKIMITKERIEFEKALSKCNDTARGQVFKSVELIQGDENNYENDNE